MGFLRKSAFIRTRSYLFMLSTFAVLSVGLNTACKERSTKNKRSGAINCLPNDTRPECFGDESYNSNGRNNPNTNNPNGVNNPNGNGQVGNANDPRNLNPNYYNPANPNRPGYNPEPGRTPTTTVPGTIPTRPGSPGYIPAPTPTPGTYPGTYPGVTPGTYPNGTNPYCPGCETWLPPC